MKSSDYIDICKSKYINCIALALQCWLKNMFKQLYFSNRDKVYRVQLFFVPVEGTYNFSSNKSCTCFAMANVALWLGIRCLTPLSTVFQLYIAVICIICGGNKSNRRKPPTSCKSLTNFITYCEYTLSDRDSNAQ